MTYRGVRAAAASTLLLAVFGAPTIPPNQILAVDESHCSPGFPVGAISASSQYFAIANFTIPPGGNPLRPLPSGSPALSVFLTSGQVTMAVALSYGPDVQPYIWNGYAVWANMSSACWCSFLTPSCNLAPGTQVKDHLDANITVCDTSGLCSTCPFTVIVTPNVTAGLGPVITGVNYLVRLSLLTRSSPLLQVPVLIFSPAVADHRKRNSDVPGGELYLRKQCHGDLRQPRRSRVQRAALCCSGQS